MVLFLLQVLRVLLQLDSMIVNKRSGKGRRLPFSICEDFELLNCPDSKSSHMSSVKLKHVGPTISVPDCDVAHLMYYLNCVVTAVHGLQIPFKFRNYIHWKCIDNDELWQIVLLAQNLNPETLNRVGVFIEVGEFQPTDKHNVFVEIDNSLFMALAPKNFCLGGVEVTRVQSMLYTEQWIIENFERPMRRLGHWDGRRVHKPTSRSRGKGCVVQ